LDWTLLVTDAGGSMVAFVLVFQASFLKN